MTDTATVERPSLRLVLTSLMRADATVLLRGRTSALLTLLPPLIIVIATDLNSGKTASRLGGAPVVIGLAITIGLVISCLLGYSLTLAHDRDAGVLQRLRVTPAPTWAIMCSRLAVQAAANLVMAVVVLIVGVSLHGLSLNAGQVILVLVFSLIGAAMFLAIGQAVVALVNSMSAVNAIGRVLLIVLILLGLLGVTGLLGDVVQSIAEWSPVGVLMQLMSQAMLSAPWAWQDTWYLVAAIGYVVVFSFIGIRWFTWGTH